MENILIDLNNKSTSLNQKGIDDLLTLLPSRDDEEHEHTYAAHFLET